MQQLEYDGFHTADEVLNKLCSLQKEVDLEDACLVERAAGGKVYIKQAVNLTALGAATGGIRDDFIKQLSEAIPPGSSVLFVVFRSVTEDRCFPNSNPISRAY
jgi:uncharacterized membrane protein